MFEQINRENVIVIFRCRHNNNTFMSFCGGQYGVDVDHKNNIELDLAIFITSKFKKGIDAVPEIIIKM